MRCYFGRRRPASRPRGSQRTLDTCVVPTLQPEHSTHAVTVLVQVVAQPRAHVQYVETWLRPYPGPSSVSFEEVLSQSAAPAPAAASHAADITSSNEDGCFTCVADQLPTMVAAVGASFDVGSVDEATDNCNTVVPEACARQRRP